MPFVAASNHQQHGQVGESRQRVEKREEAFFPPVVAYEQEDDLSLSDAEFAARILAAREPGFLIKNLVIDADIDYGNRIVRAVKTVDIVLGFARVYDELSPRFCVELALEKFDDAVI